MINEQNFSPAVYGFIFPKIYFPKHLLEELSQDQIDLIIKHEEHHIKQKHLWLNLIWDLVVCCLWFNPLTYIARQKFRHDQEVYCDYLVLNELPINSHKVYGKALLSTVSTTHSQSLLCSWKVFNQLEERIMNINNLKKASKKLTIITGCVLILTFTSIYAANNNKSTIKLYNEAEPNFEMFHNGKTFIVENDNWYVFDNGQKREMSSLEKDEFLAQKKKIEEELSKTQNDLQNHELNNEKLLAGIHKAHLDFIKNKETLSNQLSQIEKKQKEIELKLQNVKINTENLSKTASDLEKSRQQLIIKSESINTQMIEKLEQLKKE